MDKSFEVHIDRDGTIIFDNIKNVEGDECFDLTKPYINHLGEVVGVKEVQNEVSTFYNDLNESA